MIYLARILAWLFWILLLLPVSGWAEKSIAPAERQSNVIVMEDGTYLLPESGDPQIIGKDKPDCMIYEDATLGLMMEGMCTYEDVIDQRRTFTYDDLQSDTIATCDMNYQNCEIKKPSAFPCYQRMQEAMKSADKYLQGPWNEAWKEYDKWKQTMNDCVEGKP